MNGFIYSIVPGGITSPSLTIQNAQYNVFTKSCLFFIKNTSVPDLYLKLLKYIFKSFSVVIALAVEYASDAILCKPSRPNESLPSTAPSIGKHIRVISALFAYFSELGITARLLPVYALNTPLEPSVVYILTIISELNLGWKKPSLGVNDIT